MYRPTKDEIFILGNIGIAGVFLEEFELANPVIRLLQTERPKNAAGFIAGAIQLNQIHDYAGAATLLETSGALQADVNLEEAICLYLVSLLHAGEEERARELAEDFLLEGVVESDLAIRTMSEVIELVDRLQAAAKH